MEEKDKIEGHILKAANKTVYLRVMSIGLHRSQRAMAARTG